MRVIAAFVIAATASAGPVLACDLDYLPDFAGHSYRVGMDPEEAARAKEEAMANARAAFIRQYGLQNQTPVSTQLADASATTQASDAR